MFALLKTSGGLCRLDKMKISKTYGRSAAGAPGGPAGPGVPAVPAIKTG